MMGRHHARVLASLDGVDLVGRRRPGWRRRTASPAGARSWPTVEELIAHGIDYCVVAVPTVYHEQVGLALAEAGVHALIEKPLAADAPRPPGSPTRSRPRAWSAPSGTSSATTPRCSTLRARLEAGELGEVYQVATRRQGPFPARIADVGVVKDLATHDIDLTAWVTQQQFTSVSARTATGAGASTRTWSRSSAS